MMHGRARVHGDEDGVGKSVRTMASQVGGPAAGARERLEGRQGTTGGRTLVDIDGLTDLTSKLGIQSRRAEVCERF